MKKIYFLLLAFLFLFSCNDETFTNTSDTNSKANPEFNYDYGSDVSRTIYGQVLDTSGNPVQGALVSVGSETTTTTDVGFFVLKDVTVKSNFAHIKITKQGFVNASKTILPTEGDNRVNVMMIPATTTKTITAGSPQTVSLADGTKVDFDGSFVDENGNAYTGAVNVALFNLKTSDDYFNEMMPGSLLASNSQGESQMLESFGMIHVQLTGSAGQNLQLADGHPAKIKYPIDPAQKASAPTTLPLWSFDEDMGIWIEEGSATRVGDYYEASVSHFSWWNYCTASVLAHLNVYITDSLGNPVSNVLVGLKPSTWSNFIVKNYVNSNGVSSGNVIVNESLILYVYDFCGNIIHTENIGPFAPYTTNNISITVPSNVSVITNTIKGVLKDCAGNDVTNGYVKLDYASQPINYFLNNLQLVTNGNFSFTTLICSATSPFTLTGYDLNSLQSSGTITYTPSPPITNVGVITTCTNVTEFINYQIDGLPVQNCIMDMTAGIDNTNFTVKHNGSPEFVLYGSNIGSVGTYSTGFVTLYDNNYPGAPPMPNGITTYSPNNMTLNVNNIGTVGGYIDFTINGTFDDSSGVSHTFSATGHVTRDF